MHTLLLSVSLAAVGFAACASSSRAQLGANLNPNPHLHPNLHPNSRTGTVAGRVRTREAKPAPYALVSAFAAEPNMAAPQLLRTRCDGAGYFTFNQLAVGNYAFIAMSAAPQPAFTGSTLAMPVDDALAVSITLDQPSSLQ